MIISLEEFIKRKAHYIPQESIYHTESYSLSVELITNGILVCLDSHGIIILREKGIKKEKCETGEEDFYYCSFVCLFVSFPSFKEALVSI